MGAGASAQVSGASAEDLAKCASDLSEDDKKKLMEALAAAGSGGGGGAKGAKGKAPRVASPNFDAKLSDKVTADEAKAFCGGDPPACFKEGMDKADFLIGCCLIQVATDSDGLREQPAAPKKRTLLVQIYIDDHQFGGTDKSCNGHRYDSIPFANGMIEAGMSCHLVHYVHAYHDLFFKVMAQFDALLVRCNPGQIKDNGGDQNKFDDAMRAIKKGGVPVWPSPDVMTYMGAKDALTNIKDMAIGLSDTGTYYTEEELKAGFFKTMKFQRRVMKQNRGSSGEGIWIISLKSGEYCANFGDDVVKEDDMLILMEANDNHVEEHTVAEFVEWCVNGRTDKSGTWTSKGTGKYLEGGKEAGGQLVDQRFCGRILEGELRFNMVNDVCLGVIHKVPAPGGMSAVGGTGSVYEFYDNGCLTDTKMTKFDYKAFVYKEKDGSGNRHRVSPEEGPAKVESGECVEETISVDLAALTKTFVEDDCPKLMKALNLPDEPIPLWWTADFINGATGECWTQPAEQKWVVGEFNCSCVGLSKCLAAYCTPENPNVSFKDIPEQEKKDATIYGNIVGREAGKMLGI
eukprot:TRINITY_DN378_c0_g1_i5.p1 TRINITY_DN378_c0_g1~~TRINITY_DN378_c0_g1_i5.p1  ORF type:complete len:573 (-),score=190.01 TRINITY_DN378_c0_g1_i5:430-2148(-)